ncbi:MAG: S41 family peptidase [Candidatus Marinimicrobia bacterium]|nr:S41 family peptidase [Candidatus Neomarinimicrobiota bacterium]
MKYRQSFIVLFALLLLTSWAANLYTQANTERIEGEASIKQVYQTILDRYVAEIDPKKLSNAAIEGMLRELDPYSQHIDDNNSYRLDAITTGEYGGVGIHLGRMNDSLIVISPMDGTPAYRQGIHAGDRIVKIDSVWTKKLDLDEAARMVRGKNGSLITLLIKREGEPELLEFELERELIKVPDVSYSGLLRDRTGYVKLSNFSKYSAEDLEKAIRKMSQANLNALIIDVRGNPGGLLSAALMSADLFIEQGELLLETRGRINESNKKYLSRRRPIVKSDLPIAILVDGGSASASEILAGILQDYDRAVVLGKPSFGKGLVQTVTRLSPETRLKLTTAKYYLPSGRLIQKREIAEDVIHEDLLETEIDSFYSDHNRRFEAGGGVAPDLTIAALSMSSFESRLWRNRLFYKYALDYGEQHPGLTLPFQLEDAEVDTFYIWMSNRGLVPKTKLYHWITDLDDMVDSNSSVYADIQKIQTSLVDLESKHQREELQANRIQLLSGLDTELANVLGGNGARVAASLKHDPVVQGAIDVLASSSQLKELLAGSSN